MGATLKLLLATWERTAPYLSWSHFWVGSDCAAKLHLRQSGRTMCHLRVKSVSQGSACRRGRLVNVFPRTGGTMPRKSLKRSEEPSDLFANEPDAAAAQLRRLRRHEYRRILGKVKMRPDSPLAEPEAGEERAFLFGDVDDEPPYNPLLR
jgi:hypothetical protein